MTTDMLPRQLSLRTLLVLMALVAVCLVAHRSYRTWYIRHYPGHYLHTVLLPNVHNGDTRQEVALLFASGDRVDMQTDSNVQKWNFRPWPILPGDEFWQFSDSSGHRVYLQFRNGLLVNHPKANFVNADWHGQINQQPPLLLRYGVWPYGVALIVTVGYLLLAFDQKPRPSRINSSRL